MSSVGNSPVPPPFTNSSAPPPVSGSGAPASAPPSAGDLPPSSGTSTDGMDGLPPPSSDALSGAGSTPLDGLEEEFSADVYAFLALFQQLAQTMKTFAKLEATSELQAQVSALLSAAEDMKASAEKRYSAAITQAIGQIVSGVVQFAAGVLAVAATLRSASKENESIKMKEGADAIRSGAKDGAEGDFSRAFSKDMDRTAKSLEHLKNKWASISQSATAGGTGLGQTVTGSTSLNAAKDSRDAELTDAEKTEKEAVAAEHEKAYQAALEFASAMQEIISATRSVLGEIERQRHETLSATQRA